LNEQCIDLVCELSATSSHPELPQFVVQNRDLWRLVATEARSVSRRSLLSSSIFASKTPNRGNGPTKDT
jgi:hypothetical protein